MIGQGGDGGLDDVTFVIGFTAGGAVVITLITLLIRYFVKKRKEEP